MLDSLGDFLDEIFQTPVGKPAGQLARQCVDVCSRAYRCCSMNKACPSDCGYLVLLRQR